MALFQKLSYMCCQRQKEMALMIGVEMGWREKKRSVCVDAHLEFSYTCSEFLTITAHSRNVCVPLPQTF